VRVSVRSGEKHRESKGGLAAPRKKGGRLIRKRKAQVSAIGENTKAAQRVETPTYSLSFREATG